MASAVGLYVNPENLYVGIGTTVAAQSLHVIGDIITTNDITAFYSDARLKTNIRPIEQAIDKVMHLNGVYYNANDIAGAFGFDTTKTHVGVLAQDVRAVLPEVIALAPFDLTGDGSSASSENYMTVKYDKIVPLLINAIKEQQQQISVLQEAVKNYK